MVDIPNRRLDDLRHLGHQWSVRNLLDGLCNDPCRLPHFFDPNQVTTVIISTCADRNVEIELVVNTVGFGFPQIPLPAGTAQTWPRQPQIDGVFSGDDPDILCAVEPDAVFGEEGLVFIDFLWKVLDKGPDLILEPFIELILSPADAEHVRGQTRAAVVFE